jgi:cyclophilin family peptidyl-prolyl cis-trans isomerase
MMKDIKKNGAQDSRFFITTEPDATWADGKYVAFGRVVKGLDFIRGMTIIPTVPPSNYPKTPVRIIASGLL